MTAGAGGWTVLRGRIVRALHRLGWAGAVGAGLLAFSAAFAISVERDQALRREALVAERARLLRIAALPEADHRSERQRLIAFYEHFPTQGTLPGRLQRVHELAEAHGVEVSRADVRESRDVSTRLRRVILSLPVSGGFDEVYAWLGEVLATMPEVGLETLNLKRDATDTADADIEVRLAVYVREGT
ncbi:MAG: hypothetical protein JNJ44_05320 [Zoogloeaceae bacterium]|nr:hypothetical protein [Zoogloeaceae bacterium]